MEEEKQYLHSASLDGRHTIGFTFDLYHKYCQQAKVQTNTVNLEEIFTSKLIRVLNFHRFYSSWLHTTRKYIMINGKAYFMDFFILRFILHIKYSLITEFKINKSHSCDKQNGLHDDTVFYLLSRRCYIDVFKSCTSWYPARTSWTRQSHRRKKRFETKERFNIVFIYA